MRFNLMYFLFFMPVFSEGIRGTSVTRELITSEDDPISVPVDFKQRKTQKNTKRRYKMSLRRTVNGKISLCRRFQYSPLCLF